MDDYSRWPGEGAIEYARTFISEDITPDEALTFIRKLLHERNDNPRVKRCAGCGYPFIDRTKPNMAKVCGAACKSAVKTLQKRVQRARKAEVKPKKPLLYTFWLEYPYWLSEKAMLRHTGSYERPVSPEKLLQIAAAKERTQRMGGRKKPIHKPEY